jgi:hypothetical protein
MSDDKPAPIVDFAFPHNWHAEILTARPLILPPLHFVYPRDAEEIERGALEVLIRPLPAKRSPSAQEFLATCALGFRDAIVPTGLWSCPHPDDICAVSGGYAYIINAAAPEHFTMIAFRPVMELRSLPSQGLLLFVGHHALLAWSANGHAWQSEKLSDEGVTITAIEAGKLHGLSWNMITDKETPFTLDLSTGRRTECRVSEVHIKQELSS